MILKYMSEIGVYLMTWPQIRRQISSKTNCYETVLNIIGPVVKKGGPSKNT
jgi:hypothetical protein